MLGTPFKFSPGRAPLSYGVPPVVVPPAVPADRPPRAVGLLPGGFLGKWPGRAPLSYGNAQSAPSSGGTVGGIGPAGAATFVLEIEPGAHLTFSWLTDVIKSVSGLEHRISLLGAPRQKYTAAGRLLDADDRVVRAQLLAAAAQGQPFLLGLPFEELTVSAVASGVVVPVYSTALCDWTLPGQRVVVWSADRSTFGSAVVQSSTLQSITLDTDLSAIAKAGASIMPAMAVYLDPQQSFARYPVSAELWNLVAQAALFGFGGSDTMGVGATVTTFAGIPVWDRGIQWSGPTNDSLQSLSEIIDYGTTLAAHGIAPVSDWGRQVRYSSTMGPDWQWWKAFVSSVRGRQIAFLLPTGRPDILFKQKTSDTQIVVFGKPTVGAGDPRAIWSSSLAHKWIAITCTDGSVVIADIAAFVDNGDGTANVSFAIASLGGRTPRTISWAEQVRFESDDFEVAWAGNVFSYAASARVVQQ